MKSKNSYLWIRKCEICNIVVNRIARIISMLPQISCCLFKLLIHGQAIRFCKEFFSFFFGAKSWITTQILWLSNAGKAELCALTDKKAWALLLSSGDTFSKEHALERKCKTQFLENQYSDDSKSSGSNNKRCICPFCSQPLTQRLVGEFIYSSFQLFACYSLKLLNFSLFHI